jgi:hypothetical protein
MAAHLTSRRLLAALLLAAASVALPSLAQSPPQNPPPPPCPATQGQTTGTDSSGKPCTPAAPDAHKPSTAEQFPFPGSSTKTTTPPDAPGTSASPSSAAPPSAATEHPFPTTPAPRLPGDNSSSNSSSSSSSSADDPDTTPDGPPLKDEGTEGTSTRRKLPKVRKVQTDDERVDEDLKVAKFYMRDDNLPGAYLRAKDAVRVQPDYSAGHFALAEVAQKMKKKDEAVAEYQTYLKLDPDGEKAKDAQKALAELK